VLGYVRTGGFQSKGLLWGGAVALNSRIEAKGPAALGLLGYPGEGARLCGGVRFLFSRTTANTGPMAERRSGFAVAFTKVL